MSNDDFKARMDYHVSVSIKSSVQDKVRGEELLEKYVQNLRKFEVAHTIAMVLHVVILKKAIEEQWCGMSSIFKALDSKTQILKFRQQAVIQRSVRFKVPRLQQH
jgi:hypothetical protein